MKEKAQYEQASAHGAYTAVFHSFEPTLAAQYYCVDNAGWQSCALGYRISRKDTNSFLLMTTTAGRGRLEHGGAVYDITPDTLVFLDCMEKHTYYTRSQEPWQTVWLHFTGAVSQAFYSQLCGRDGPVLRLGSTMARLVESTIEDIVRLKQNGEYLFDIMASDAISGLLHKMVLRSSAPVISKEHAYVTDAIDYIRANYQNDITLGDIAAAVHLSKYYFSKQFKVFTGFSPYDYLIRHRIGQAKMLLATTSQPVSAIARMVGFNSATNFISAFRTYENTTPLQYQKNILV